MRGEEAEVERTIEDEKGRGEDTKGGKGLRDRAKGYAER